MSGIIDLNNNYALLKVYPSPQNGEELDAKEPLYKMECPTFESVEKFLENYGQSYGFSYMNLIIPAEINAKNVFLPTFINVALEIDGLAGKIFVGILYLTLDLLSLPLRLITLIPKAIYNNSKDSRHPLVKLIEDTSNQTISSNHLRIVVTKGELKDHSDPKNPKKIEKIGDINTSHGPFSAKLEHQLTEVTISKTAQKRESPSNHSDSPSGMSKRQLVAYLLSSKYLND